VIQGAVVNPLQRRPAMAYTRAEQAKPTYHEKPEGKPKPEGRLADLIVKAADKIRGGGTCSCRGCC
jgi:hypothetical protein